jgi:hypothetical protein
MAKPKDSGQKKDFVNWSRREPKDAAKKCWEMGAKAESQLGWRFDMAMRGALAYSGAGLGDLFASLGLQFDHPMTERALNRRHRTGGFANRTQEQHARAMIQTIVEKLLGMEEPKTQLVGTDCEWEVRRQGIWADRFVEGTYHLTQGCYPDFWEMARQGGLLAFAATGTVAIRTEPDFVAKRVRSRLRSTLNTFIDPADMGADRPLSYFDVTWESPEYLCEDERFKGKQDAIWKAAVVPRHMLQGTYSSPTFGTPMVKVLTAWRMPFGTFKGRHAIFLSSTGENTGDEPLHWEDWDCPEPPLAFFRCYRSLSDDFWGENMIEPALDPLRDAEDVDAKAKTTMKRTSQTYLHLDGNSAGPAALMNAKDVAVCRYDSKKGEKKIEVDKPGILHSDYAEWRDRKIQLAHDLVGVSLMHQSGEVQGASGQRSGRSIRLEASLLPERFARLLRAWRNWVAVDCAKNHIRAAKQIGEVDPDWQVTWPGADFDAKVSVKVLDIDLEAYSVQAYAVSEQKNTPQDRADAAQEMFDRGEITAEQLSVIVEGIYDTKRETKSSTVERSYVMKVADEMLHGDPELIGDENAYMRDEYIPPMNYQDPDAMLAQLSPILTQAMIDRVPQNRRHLLRRFMEDIWALRQQQTRDVAMAKASVNVAATPEQAFPMGAPALPPGGPIDPNALPPPATPGAALGAPAAAPPPFVPPPGINAGGPIGLG